MNNDSVKYSIIIPVYNEGKFIANLLEEIEIQSRQLSFKIEVIVVNGESTDDTINICRKYNVIMLNSHRNRGKQLKEGALLANGENLLFLHADLMIPSDMFYYLENNFGDEVDIATFKMKFDRNEMLYKFYSFFTHFDSIFSTFGDQGLIVCKSIYDKIGGFKELPIMEDVDFFRRARKLKKIKKLNKFVIASSRRFRSIGIVKTQLRSALYIIKFFLGASTEKIYKDYYNLEYEREGSHNFCKVSTIGESENPIGLNNK